MDENPYQPPQEASRRPTARQGLAIGVLVPISIPAGCICGGITCFAMDVVLPPRESYFSMKAILIGLVVIVLVPVATYLYGKLTKVRS